MNEAGLVSLGRAEEAIHRFDAETSRGVTCHFDRRSSADMPDELLTGFAPLRTDLAGVPSEWFTSTPKTSTGTGT